ncbi:MAG: hypothetical protein HY553_17570 [Elusimicrobia bacterium]|nr:hypothetical protein [Elusimicrobiota bacterium]
MPRLIPWLFLLSGFTGLVYEVVWARALGQTFGNTALAHTAVLSASLGGLAASNGRRVPRRRGRGRLRLMAPKLIQRSDAEVRKGNYEKARKGQNYS